MVLPGPFDYGELILQVVLPTKGVKQYFQLGPLSGILTITIPQHAVNRI